jgi:D-arabinose 1-dehydrogenase-like Zn-dependent alcohol dehydrogenase
MALALAAIARVAPQLCWLRDRGNRRNAGNAGNAAYERLVKGDVKYRFVIDMSSLR